MDQAEMLFHEGAVRAYCEAFVEALKSTSMAGALRKYKTLLGDLIQIQISRGGAANVDLHTAVLNTKVCCDLRNVVIQTLVLKKHTDLLVDGSEHQAKLTSIQEQPAVAR